jgi:hypothetical protein
MLLNIFICWRNNMAQKCELRNQRTGTINATSWNYGIKRICGGINLLVSRLAIKKAVILVKASATSAVFHLKAVVWA